ncbi:uncharacterized protein Bfra_005229 [Botrytis fragariae]|uniref:Uncharacterized protein n=1 Tax=Botrytis fragariae TaxID=1964551 RepID=A0A8H6EJ33_9HELO|nr:uncharacterized protein Bfra_005229 [Botrytis fragariae]KAF5873765.1 hypothetical protein Bfra_005229 [Botrytis fragariae]
MDGTRLFSELKARIIDLEKQLEEKDELWKVANSKIEKLRETISVQIKPSTNETAQSHQFEILKLGMKKHHISSISNNNTEKRTHCGNGPYYKEKRPDYTENDLLISSADPNAIPLYADTKVACLGGLSVKEVQVDIKGRTINDCVIKLFVDQLIRLYEKYDDVNAACQRQMITESLKKPLYEIGLKFPEPENHAAHGADAFADAQMILETDSKTDVERGISGKRGQFMIIYLVPPETVINFGSVWNDSYSPKFTQLLKLYQDLKIWRDEGIGILEFASRRYHITRLVNIIYPSEELYNAEAFDADEAAIKKFNELWDASRELQDEQRKFRHENNSLFRKDLHRRSLEETSRGINALRSATLNLSFSIIRSDSKRSLK